MFLVFGRASIFVLSFAMISTLGRCFTVRASGFNSANRMRRFASYADSPLAKFDVSATTAIEYAGDTLVIPFFKPESTLKDDKSIAAAMKSMVPPVSSQLRKLIEDVLDENVFKGDDASSQIIRTHGTPNMPRYVALVGLGPQSKKVLGTDVDVSTGNRLGAYMTSIAARVKAEQIGLITPKGLQNAGLTQIVLGVHDAAYDDTRFKKVPEGGHKTCTLKSIQLLGCSQSVASDAVLTHGLSETIASGVKFAKDLVGAPANSKTPLEIVKQARKIAAESGMEINVLGEQECKDLGMGGYLAVQQGSRFPPQFIHMVYRPAHPTADLVKVALVGKGLTFDSGGYNLKVGAGSSIELMKFDMGGCGAMLGCAKTIGQLKPNNVEVHFISAVCENMVSAEAMRPGDIVTSSNGKTIEIINTDAEGRLTLADALVYAEKLQVDTIIDLATLTGAAVVGLGENLAGLYSTSDKLRADLHAAADRANEGIWPMPLEERYAQYVKSNIADLKNVGAKGGGSITAALFLREFVEKTAWAHIDMAGPVWDSSANKPTGYGVKLLVDYLLNAKKTSTIDASTPSSSNEKNL